TNERRIRHPRYTHLQRTPSQHVGSPPAVNGGRENTRGDCHSAAPAANKKAGAEHRAPHPPSSSPAARRRRNHGATHGPHPSDETRARAKDGIADSPRGHESTTDHLYRILDTQNCTL